MEKENQLHRIKAELALLPKGNITYKTIRGKERMYLQWSENGKKYNKYVKAADEEAVRTQIERRNYLAKEYSRLCVAEEKASYGNSYYTNVVRGKQLQYAFSKVTSYKKRFCYAYLKRYLEADILGRVCIIYGLRRTGKTTMLLQALAELPLEQTAYIKILPSNTMEMLNRDLQALSEQGCRYVFIDEVTLLRDFISSASLLSDVYAMFGMKVVLSGTDSLGFAIVGQEELYDRAVTIHTTFISFREYAELLGIHDIDEYIRYGGTFKVGETDFDDPELEDDGVSFRDDESTRRYIDTAIARNIQHSLAYYEEGSHFCHLLELYENKELTNAINRLVEDMNHRFLMSVLQRNFKSHDLGSIAQLESKRAASERRLSVLEFVDKQRITEVLMRLLDIRNADKLQVTLDPNHIEKIRAYLKLLDLIIPLPIERMGSEPPQASFIFTQPGMRYCQAQALVHTLMKDKVFKNSSAVEQKTICERLLEEVRGRLLEEIILLETIKAAPKKLRVFKLLFDIGEFDMVVCDTEAVTCKIYEIKHTDKIDKHQCKNLLDKEKCSMTEFVYGTIVEKIVLYQGQECEVDGIKYKNIVAYLENL